jgi:hypothetical protein
MTPTERVAAVREEALHRGDMHLVAECDQQLARWGVGFGDELVTAQPPLMERAVPRKNARGR